MLAMVRRLGLHRFYHPAQELPRTCNEIVLAADYVHLNPARAGLLAAGQELAICPESSHPAYLSSPRTRTAWLRVDHVLGEHGIQRDDARGRREFGRQIARLQRKMIIYLGLTPSWMTSGSLVMAS
jgi:hypothetical protein